MISKLASGDCLQSFTCSGHVPWLFSISPMSCRFGLKLCGIVHRKLQIPKSRFLDEIARVYGYSCSTRWLQPAPGGVPGVRGSGTTVGGFCRETTQLSNATEIAGNRLRVSALQHRDKKNHVQVDTFGAISRVRSTRPECAR